MGKLIKAVVVVFGCLLVAKCAEAQAKNEVCSTKNGEISCCASFQFQGQNPNVCLKVKPLKEELAVNAKAQLNNKVVAEKKFTIQDIPICVPLGQVPLQLCFVCDKIEQKNNGKDGKFCSTMFIKGSITQKEWFRQKLPCMTKKGTKLKLENER